VRRKRDSESARIRFCRALMWVWCSRTVFTIGTPTDSFLASGCLAHKAALAETTDICRAPADMQNHQPCDSFFFYGTSCKVALSQISSQLQRRQIPVIKFDPAFQRLILEILLRPVFWLPWQISATPCSAIKFFIEGLWRKPYGSGGVRLRIAAVHDLLGLLQLLWRYSPDMWINRNSQIAATCSP
jgi:hypothetical protein